MYVLWGIWRCRNATIFEERHPNYYSANIRLLVTFMRYAPGFLGLLRGLFKFWIWGHSSLLYFFMGLLLGDDVVAEMSLSFVLAEFFDSIGMGVMTLTTRPRLWHYGV